VRLQLRSLRADELARLTGFERSTYDLIFSALARYPWLPLDEARSRFSVIEDETVVGPGDIAHYVYLELVFQATGWPSLTAVFSSCPEDIRFNLKDVPGWGARLWTLANSAPEFNSELGRFLDDVLTGAVQFVVWYSNGKPYKWLALRNDVKFWSHRKWIYSIWGRRERSVLRCAAGQAGNPGDRNGDAAERRC
jgi:hypothetical protein